MSISRRRVLALLTLTTILLITLDLRGSATINSARNGFGDVIEPLQRAGRVVAKPIENAWKGITSYEEVQEENDRLRQQIAQQEADHIAAKVATREYQELQAIEGLDLDYSNVAAQVLQYSAQNFQQTVEINVGTDDGVRVGMAVVSAGRAVVGKITKVYSSRSIVMLVTDPQYTVSVKVIGDVPIPGSSADPNATTTTAPPTTIAAEVVSTPLDVDAGIAVLPEEIADPLATSGGTTTTIATTTTRAAPATTTTIAIEDLAHRELGGLEGQGQGQAPIVALVNSDRRALEIKVGDVVATSGECQSLAPADLVVGTVSKVDDRPGSAGPLIEVQPAADLSKLNFVVVVLFLPPAEVPGTCE